LNVDFFIQNTNGALIEAEVNPSGAASFEADYLAITGNQPILGVGYQHQTNKWGTECRIYFNCDTDLNDQFSALGIDVEQGARPYRNEWKYRVNNNEFFWALIRAGYKLGRN
jgi:hypothetical protein